MEDARRDGHGPPALHTILSSLTFLPVPPSFVCGFAMTYPKQTTRKRGKRSGAATGPRGRRGAGRTRGREREREIEKKRKKKERDVKGTERDGKRGWKRAAFAPTHAREVATHGWQGGAELSLRERRKSARAERGGVRGTEFILRAFFYRSLTPCSSAAPRRECSALLHDKIALAGAAGRKR